MSGGDSNTDVNRRAKAWNEKDTTFAAHAASRHIPLAGTFELTARCNLRCKMCYVRMDQSQFAPGQRELTAAEWIALGKDAAAAGTLNMLITGGEPLLRPDFPEIYTALSQMGFIIILYTNATLMTPELLALFQRYPPTMVGVTLYGACRETYAKICGDPDAFDATIRGLEMLTRVKTTLEVRCTFIKDNMDELNALRAIANRFTNRFAVNFDVFKAIRGATSNVADCRLTPAQMLDLRQKNHEYYDGLNSETQAVIEDSSPIEQTIDTREYGFSIEPAILGCLAAKSMYWITWDGKMLACGSFSSPYTFPLSEGFVPAWNRLPGLFEGVRYPEECYSCEYISAGCPNCPATVQSESGSMDMISSYICAIAKERWERSKA